MQEPAVHSHYMPILLTEPTSRHQPLIVEGPAYPDQSRQLSPHTFSVWVRSTSADTLALHPAFGRRVSHYTSPLLRRRSRFFKMSFVRFACPPTNDLRVWWGEETKSSL